MRSAHASRRDGGPVVTTARGHPGARRRRVSVGAQEGRHAAVWPDRPPCHHDGPTAAQRWPAGAVSCGRASPRLPAATRERVKALEGSIEAYQRLAQESQAEVRSPRLAQRESELGRIEKNLARYDGPLSAWPETRLARRQQEWKADAAALRQA